MSKPANILLVLSAITALGLVSCKSERAEPEPTPAPAAERSRTQEGTTQAASEATPASREPAAAKAASFDQRFIDMMAPHHESGIEMAKIAEQRASRPELKKKASEMIAKQSEEVRQLKQWRKLWFGSDETPPMNAAPMLSETGKQGPQDMTEHVSMLRKAENVDRAFIEHMIPHHRQGIEAAKLAQQKADHAELKQMAAKATADQERELKQFENWKAKWFEQDRSK